jgi:hypothetical protein
MAPPFAIGALRILTAADNGPGAGAGSPTARITTLRPAKVAGRPRRRLLGPPPGTPIGENEPVTTEGAES